MDIIWLGYAAALFTTVAWMPQALKTFRTKSTRDLSLPTMGVISIGLTLWLAYGVLRNDPALIISNGVQVPITYWLVAMKLRYG